jgi:hypothetical protein
LAVIIPWKQGIIITSVHQDGKRNLLLVADGGSLFRGATRLGEDWEQDGSEDRDDRNHHEQFDKGKSASFHNKKWAPFWFLKSQGVKKIGTEMRPFPTFYILAPGPHKKKQEECQYC